MILWCGGVSLSLGNFQESAAKKCRKHLRASARIAQTEFAQIYHIWNKILPYLEQNLIINTAIFETKSDFFGPNMIEFRPSLTELCSDDAQTKRQTKVWSGDKRQTKRSDGNACNTNGKILHLKLLWEVRVAFNPHRAGGEWLKRPFQ